MPTYQQTRRLLSVNTPLGADVLLLTGFTGSEAMSQLFSYQLDMLSPKPDITAKDIVGKGVTWSVQHVAKEPRFFHGVVSRFTASGQRIQKLRVYRAEIVPWLWFLTRTTDCRIFQDKTTPEIIEAIFATFGFTDYDKSGITRSYPKWEYCVQYRESAFNFVSRLMEQDGIFYFFRHEDGKHTLVLADGMGACKDCKENEVTATPVDRSPNQITSWEHQYEFRTGKWAHTDYNFETPSANMLANTKTLVDLPGVDKFEQFDYPGIHKVKSDGERIVKLRMEEEEASHDVVTGASGCCTFTPGGKFTLKAHAIESEAGKSYVLRSVEHTAIDRSLGSESVESEYSNEFTCIPSTVTFRPERVTSKPVVPGAQTAVVVGPAGEEIYKDDHGRIKVQFFWDRYGTKNEKSSCWIRVTEAWAGKGWGSVSTPRIGQEVVVDFLEGDPDRPLVTGRVYNAEQPPPYKASAGAGNVTGLKSNSTKGGGGYNEFSLDDSKGKELIVVHAQFDMDAVIEHDDRQTVHNDRTITVDNDEQSRIKHDRTETVDNNETITIGNDRKETVKANESIDVVANRTRTVGQNESVTVSMMRTHTVGINETISVGAAQEVTVGVTRAVTVGTSQTVNIGTDLSTSVGSNMSETIGADRSEAITGNHSTTVGKDQSVTITKKLVIDAGEEILIKTGDASILMKKDGSIQIKGKDILVEASGKITEKADGDFVMKGSKISNN